MNRKCKKCGADVMFKQSKHGRWYVVNLDNTDHYFECRNRLHPESASETFKISGGFIPMNHQGSKEQIDGAT